MKPKKQLTKGTAVSAFRTKEGHIGELLHNHITGHTSFAVARDGEVIEHKEWAVPGNDTLIAIPGYNNLLRHRAVLLPEQVCPYGNVATLVDDIGSYLDRYVDLSPAFRIVSIHYVLLTWVYDAFNELPYLRFRGEPGSGKTRALIVLGSICYQAFLASGASTVSPIFHTLDTFRGTFVFDEADFRFSDEKLELVKILNNGNVRGFPVFRSMATPQKLFDPRAFHVFGPKIIAMRHAFADRALESRLLTEEMGQRSHRLDIPINLPDVQADEARQLRNKLLSYRFHTLPTMAIRAEYAHPDLSSRLNQILVPLLSVIEDEQARRAIIMLALDLQERERSERSQLPEVLLLSVLADLSAENERGTLPLADITCRFEDRHGSDFERPITARYVGSLLRKRLHLMPYKTNGTYVLAASEWTKVEALMTRFGIEPRTTGNVGDKQ